MFALVQKLALSHPGVSFQFIRDGKRELMTPGDGKLSSALYAVLGRDMALGFTPVRGEGEDVTVTGFVSLPACCRGSRNWQFFFVNGRQVKSPLMAVSNPFVFGEFQVYEGRDSYTLSGANIKEYFLDLAQMQPGVYYGFYFLELAEYFGQEGNDETQMLNLLYVTMNAIRRGKQDLRLIRCIFELRTITISGEAPQMFSCMECGTKENLIVFSLRDSAIYCPNCGKTIRDPWPLQPGTVLACRYIIAAPLAKLYGFTVNEEILDELERLLRAYLHRYVEKKMKTLQILDVMK